MKYVWNAVSSTPASFYTCVCFVFCVLRWSAPHGCLLNTYSMICSLTFHYWYHPHFRFYVHSPSTHQTSYFGIFLHLFFGMYLCRCHSNPRQHLDPLLFRNRRSHYRSCDGYCNFSVFLRSASDWRSFSDMLSTSGCPKQIWKTEKHKKAYVCRVSILGHPTISEHAFGVGSPRGQCALPVQ
jgi:hypothetical protein